MTMDDVRVIKLEVVGDDALSVFEKAAQAIDKLETKVERLARAFDGMASSAAKATGGGGSQGGNQGGSVARTGGNGPYQNLAHRQSLYQQALQSGDPNQIADAQYALTLAKRRQARANATTSPGFGGSDAMTNLHRIMSSSRIGMGGGGLQFQPLLGALANGSPLVIATTVAAAAITGLAAAAMFAANQLNLTGQGRVGLGAGTGDIRTAQRISDFTGSDFMADATQLANRIATDPVAQQVANELGIRDFTGFAQNRDPLQQKLELVKRLRAKYQSGAINRKELAFRVRSLGLNPDESELYEASDATFDRITAGEGDQKRDTSRAIKDRLDAEAGFAEGKSIIRETVDAIGSGVRYYAGKFMGWVTSSPGGLVPGGPSGSPEKNDLKDLKNAMERQTEATLQNTRALGEAREIIGGGSNAGRAVPSAWRYQNLEDNIKNLGGRLGGL